jgi:hypothetical protein
MCDHSLVVRYIYAWTYDWVSSKYKIIVLVFCDIHSVDVLLTIKKTSFAVVSVIDHYSGLIMLFLYLSLSLIFTNKDCIKLFFT